MPLWPHLHTAAHGCHACLLARFLACLQRRAQQLEASLAEAQALQQGAESELQLAASSAADAGSREARALAELDRAIEVGVAVGVEWE